jgi:hypothetical protein
MGVMVVQVGVLGVIMVHLAREQQGKVMQQVLVHQVLVVAVEVQEKQATLTLQLMAVMGLLII